MLLAVSKTAKSATGVLRWKRDEDKDLVLDRKWFIRTMISYGVPADRAPLLWDAQEDEFGSKLKATRENGETRLTLPGFVSRSISREQHLELGDGADGDRFRTPPPRAVFGRDLLDSGRSLGGRGHGDGARSLGGSGSDFHPEVRGRQSEGHSGERGVKRPRSPSPRQHPELSLDSRLAALSETNISRQYPGGPPEDSDDGGASDVRSVPPSSLPASGEATSGEGVKQFLYKSKVAIRDAPRVFEESAGLWHMQHVIEKYVAALLRTEEVR